jgi:hypothetical protein
MGMPSLFLKEAGEARDASALPGRICSLTFSMVAADISFLIGTIL